MDSITAWFSRLTGKVFVLILFSFIITGCAGGNAPTLPDAVSQNSGDAPDMEVQSDSGLTPGQYGTSINTLEGKPDYVDAEVLVVLHEGTVTPNASLLAVWPLEPVQKIECRWGTVYRLHITDDTTVPDMVARLKADPMVRFAEPNGIYYFEEAPHFPNDPLWAYDNDPENSMDSPYDQWGPSMIGASIVWNEMKGSEEVTVAIMDTGVRQDHQDLADNVWINEDEIPDNGTDDDLNGWVDDWWGWNCWENNNDPWDDGSYASYHGSACSGVAAAVQDNNAGMSGVAPGVKIMAIKVDLSGSGAYESSIIMGFDYAVMNRADIVSMSFRKYEWSDIMNQACADAWNDGNGVILMGGIGNESTTEVCYPNGYESVMAIGGSCPFTNGLSRRDEKRIEAYEDGYYWGSNYGSHMTVMGYGAQYTTTYGGHYDSYWDGGYYGFFSGTSCATPFAAGAMALIRSYFPYETPAWSWDRIEDTADDLDIPGFDIETGHGRVNALRAIYGPDRFSDLEDGYGFVPFDFAEKEMFDTIHDVPGNPYEDVEDLYKVVLDQTGSLIIDLSIFTWGENLDVAVYADKEMTDLVAESTGPNHYNSSLEHLDVDGVNEGEKYFIRVYSPAPGNSTTYGLKIQRRSNTLNVTGEDLAPFFLHQYGNVVPFLKLTLEIGWHAILEGINISKSGTVASPDLALVHLYLDSNGNGEFDEDDELVAQEVPPGTNRVQFTDIGIEWYIDEPLVLFVAADIGYSPDGSNVRLSLESYKDVITEEGIQAHYSQFPIMSGLVEIGTDSAPPVWATTTGCQTAVGSPSSAILQFNEAVDDLTPPVMYNIYYTDTLPFDIGTAAVVPDVETWEGSVTDLEAKVSGILWDNEWHFVVRAEDQSGNEDENLVIQSCTPLTGGDPTNPVILNTYPDACNNVDFDGDLLVVTRNWAGLKAFDRSDPINLVEVSEWDSGDNYYDVAVSGDFCYTSGQYHLGVFDLTDPANPSEVIIYDDIEPSTIVANGNWIYANESYPNRLIVMDASDPYDINFAPDVSLNPGYKRDMLVYNNYMYMAHGNDGILVFDITNPGAPSQVSNFGPTNLIMMDIDNGILSTVNTIGYVTTYDYSVSPTNPPYLDMYTNPDASLGEDIVAIGDYVYVSLYYEGIWVFDVSDPDNITRVGDLEFNHIEGLVNDGPIIYAAASNGLNVII